MAVTKWSCRTQRRPASVPPRPLSPPPPPAPRPSRQSRHRLARAPRGLRRALRRWRNAPADPLDGSITARLGGFEAAGGPGGGVLLGVASGPGRAGEGSPGPWKGDPGLASAGPAAGRPDHVHASVLFVGPGRRTHDRIASHQRKGGRVTCMRLCLSPGPTVGHLPGRATPFQVLGRRGLAQVGMSGPGHESRWSRRGRQGMSA